MAKIWAKAFYNGKPWKHSRNCYIAKRIMIDGGLCEICQEVPGYIVAPLMTAQGVSLIDDGNHAESAEDDMFASLEYRNAFKNYIINGTPIPDKFKNAAETTTSTTAGTTVPTNMYG